MTGAELYPWQDKDISIESKPDSKRLYRPGIIMLIAIGLHNLPEGLAIGAAGGHDAKLGVTVAVILARHNISEGMAASGVLKAGGLRELVLFVIFAEVTALIGALVGFGLGSVNATFSTLCLALAGRAMLYIVFGEIIPQSSSMTKSKTPAIVALAGGCCGVADYANSLKKAGCLALKPVNPVQLPAPVTSAAQPY